MNELFKTISGLLLFSVIGVGAAAEQKFDESNYKSLPQVEKLTDSQIIEKTRRDGIVRVENIFDDKLLDDMYNFASIGVPKQLTTHYNVQVPLLRHVVPFMHTFMDKFHNVITKMIGSESKLFELALLVNYDGATRQRIHADFDFEIPGSSKMVSFLVALQDVSIDMGPTEIWNGTHSREAHNKYCPKVCEEALLQDDNMYPTYANLNIGETLVLDSTIIHRGGPSTNPKARIYVWISFIASPGKAPGGSPPTIFPDYLRKFKTREYRDWASKMHIPTSIVNADEHHDGLFVVLLLFIIFKNVIYKH